VSRNGDPFTFEIVGIHGTDPRKRMTDADEHHPILVAELEGPEVGRTVTSWRNESIEASGPEIAPKRSAVGFDHGDLDSGPLSAEPQ
jgi:hypothetical protein